MSAPPGSHCNPNSPSPLSNAAPLSYFAEALERPYRYSRFRTHFRNLSDASSQQTWITCLKIISAGGTGFPGTTWTRQQRKIAQLELKVALSSSSSRSGSGSGGSRSGSWRGGDKKEYNDDKSSHGEVEEAQEYDNHDDEDQYRYINNSIEQHTAISTQSGSSGISPNIDINNNHSNNIPPYNSLRLNQAKRRQYEANEGNNDLGFTIQKRRCLHVDSTIVPFTTTTITTTVLTLPPSDLEVFYTAPSSPRVDDSDEDCYEGDVTGISMLRREFVAMSEDNWRRSRRLLMSFGALEKR